MLYNRKTINNQKSGRKIYIYAGNEEFLKERAFDKLVNSILPPQFVAENLHKINFDQDTDLTLLQHINSFSFNTFPKIFAIYNIDSLSASQKNKVITILSNLAQLENIVCVVFSNDSSIITALEKELGTLCEKLEFWQPFANQTVEWLQKEAFELGLNLTKEGAETLLELVGTDLRLLYQELEKIAINLYKASNQNDEKLQNRNTKILINSEIIENFCSYIKQDSFFELIEAIGLRKIDKVIEVYNSLLSQGENIIKIWAVVTSTFRDFRTFLELCYDRPDLLSPIYQNLVKILSLHNKSDYKSNLERKKLISDIQNFIASLPEFFRKILSNYAKKITTLAFAINYSAEELRKKWHILLETDVILKSSAFDERTYVECKLVELILKPRR